MTTRMFKASHSYTRFSRHLNCLLPANPRAQDFGDAQAVKEDGDLVAKEDAINHPPHWLKNPEKLLQTPNRTDMAPTRTQLLLNPDTVGDFFALANWQLASLQRRRRPKRWAWHTVLSPLTLLRLW